MLLDLLLLAFPPQAANQRNKKLFTSKKTLDVNLQAFFEREIQIAMNRTCFHCWFFSLNISFVRYIPFHTVKRTEKKMVAGFLHVFSFLLPSFLFLLWKCNVSAVRKMDCCQEIIYQAVEKVLKCLRLNIFNFRALFFFRHCLCLVCWQLGLLLLLLCLLLWLEMFV